ncbi:hypothetical protein [Gordonia sihwensis]|uniref:hypothetical protein n=1 Tax=Gordonia sihwensis TaxID=173559 RepID=UPI0005F0A9BE|nr:hypothetical protein [Gordonia sihwensis]KJR10486.1 hypothetical protein UG54_00340 [Gordonia sihwensis]
MVAAVLSRTHRPAARTARPTPPIPVRECDRRPELFDLPEPARVEAAANPLAGTDDGFITLDAVTEESAATARFARAAKKAVGACERCPFLQQCQRETTEQLFAGQRPQTEVRGAVAFDAEGLPAKAVHNSPRRRDLDQLTLDVELDLTGVRHDPRTDWVPAELEPVGTHDPYAIRIALDEQRTDTVVTQSYLDAKPAAKADGRIVLSYTDEIALLRAGLTDGLVTKNRLKQVLDTKWEKVAELAHILGFAPEGKYSPSPWAQRRRSLAAADSQASAAAATAAHREQYARDLAAIRRNIDHDRILDLADRSHVAIFGGPTPLSSRVRRTTLVGHRSEALSRFAHR